MSYILENIIKQKGRCIIGLCTICPINNECHNMIYDSSIHNENIERLKIALKYKLNNDIDECFENILEN